MPKEAKVIGVPSWVTSIAFTAAIAGAYFLGARLSLALLEPDGVAVFWSAAGIGTGLLIAFGPPIRWQVAFGVASATIAANLMGDRNLDASILFALCNVAETLIISWLIEYWFGFGFSLDSSQRVLGFFAAIASGAALSGVGGAAGFVLFHSSGAQILTTWFNWFSSDALGVVTVAPLMIGFARALDDPPKKAELLERSLALGVLAAVSALGFGAPPDYWFTILPLTFIFPLLLWPAAHCRPVFTAAAALILALAIVWTITFGIGPLGDPSIPLVNRVHAAEAALLAISVCALGLPAVFAERRRSEIALKESNHRLQLALDGASLGVWSVEVKTKRFENDARDRIIQGHHLDEPPRTLEEARSFVHPDDIPIIDKAFSAAARSGSNCNVVYRLNRDRDSGAQGRQDRWVALEGSIVRNAIGEIQRWVGVTRDITARKLAEQALAERDAQLAMAGNVALIGGFTFDIGSGELQVSPGYVAIHGLAEGTVITSRSEWRARVHADDLPRLEVNLRRDIESRRRDHYCEYRVVRSGGETRWIEARSFISYGNEGSAPRIIGVNIDVTERKQSEEKLKKSEQALRELLGALPAAVYVTDAAGRITYCNKSAINLWGATPNLGRDRWCDFSRFYHADGTPMAREDCPTEIALTPGQIVQGPEAIMERADGTRIPIIAYPTPLRDRAGAIAGVVNMTVDISDRKRAELALSERNLQLALAGKAGLVGTYAYDTDTDDMQISEGYAAIHGLPEGLQRCLAAGGRLRSILGIWPGCKCCESKSLRRGSLSRVLSIALSEMARFAGSSHAASSHTTTKDAHGGSLGSTLMSLRANEPKSSKGC
jgi:PAS domain S-box-containing protein